MKFLLHQRVNINSTNPYKCTAAYLCCSFNQFKTLKLLVESGADLKIPHISGVSCFSKACEKGFLKIAQFLFENGAHSQKDQPDKEGFTPIQKAAAFASIDMMKYLILIGCDYNQTDVKGRTCFWNACFAGNLEVVKLLDSLGCDASVPNANDITPLYVACQEGHFDVVQFLIDRTKAKTQVDRFNTSNKTRCIQIAAQHLNIVKYLHSICNSKLMMDRDDPSPLFDACLGGHVEVVKYLVQVQCPINQTNKRGRTPIWHACYAGKLNVVKFLHSVSRECVMGIEGQGIYPLWIAIKRGHLDVVKYLIENTDAKHQLEIRDSAEETPFHVACVEGNMEMIRYLCSKNKSVVNWFNEKGETPFFSASSSGNLELVKYLISDCGVDPFTEHDSYTTPLLISCEKGHFETLKYFVSIGIDLTQIDEKGKSVLHLACAKGDIQLIKYLINAGADFKQESSKDKTCLYDACENGDLRIVKYLIEELGMEITSQEAFGAVQNNHLDVLKYLVSIGTASQKCCV